VVQASKASAQQGVSSVDAVQAREALSELCRLYWYPVYAFIRRRRGADRAADLTQEFLLSLIERGSFAQADPSRGRFRSWLLGALGHFLANEARHAAAAKRNGGPHVSIDEAAAERRFASEPRTELTPERLYDRAFSLCVLESAIARLGEEMAQRGQAERFAVIKRLLPGRDLEEAAYAPLAAALGVSPNTFKKIVFDGRARFRVHLDAVIADLVGLPDASGPQTRAEHVLAGSIAEERELLMRALSLPPA